ncbi:SPFH domain-containing protein [Pseudenhygromyxa sp. WMMC2535]|uniref:SPFH domain-containing protein n=1 Tax=Pseudenhygromyxa sp. WMMC2535 TaxID=2712867 RepID=UPI00155198FF|nr:SPFH domain-containing protein [Pseudenhygromyxa sp. WMMC2535]NVB39781.1 SPFH domain-containing protein [Pseudenhygromyxa sp. WMMC2535]
MQALNKICRVFVLVFLVLLVIRGLLIANVELGEVGVRRSNVAGVVEQDLDPGWQLEVIGLHKIVTLPGTYQFLDFLGNDALEIRTKDNNIVTLDISVPYRIRPGEAWEIVSAGNHVSDGQSGYRFQRLTRETTVGVLRQHLADLQSSDFYDTDRRNAVSDAALDVLNEQLAALHVEADAILMRAVFFRDEYESQLLQIQLNAQNKLLDGARKEVADKQQKLDNFQQKTIALGKARGQDWVAKLARVDRAYQVGFLAIKPSGELVLGGGGAPGEDGEIAEGDEGAGGEGAEGEGAEGEGAEGEGAEGEGAEGEGVELPEAPQLSEAELAELEALVAESEDLEPGAARRRLEQLTKAQKLALQLEAAKALGGEAGEYGDNYLLGIKNIEAETLAYDKRVRAEAEGVAARLEAEGDALVAEVVGEYQASLNQLLGSPAGRAFVAWKAAANVKFADELTFQSDDGIPSVLRLRDFARAFMGQ